MPTISTTPIKATRKPHSCCARNRAIAVGSAAFRLYGNAETGDPKYTIYTHYDAPDCPDRSYAAQPSGDTAQGREQG